MNDVSPSPAAYAEAFASWRSDSPVPAATETRLTLQLTSLRGLSGVRRQVQQFLLSSLGDGSGNDVPPAAEDLVESTILVIDELASNALRHGAPPSSLHINDEDGRWIVVVTDSSPDRPPTPALDRPAGQGDYGLYVVADLTNAHGVHYETDRKLVWVCVAKPA